MASICNAEWGRLGGTSGHGGFVHTLSGEEGQVSRAEEELIALCYEAGGGRVPWEDVLQRLAAELDLLLAQVVGIDFQQGRLLYSFEGGTAPNAGLIDYARSFHRVDPHVQYGIAAPVGQFVSFDEVLPAIEIERHPFYQDFLRVYGGRHVHGVKLYHEGAFAVLLGLHRAFDRQALAGEDRALPERLSFHLTRSMQMYMQLRTSFAEAAVGRAMLDRLNAAVLLVDHERGVHERNAAADALMRRTPAIGTDATRRLRCADSAADAELGLALKSLRLGAHPGDAGLMADRCVLPVPAAGQLRPLIVSLLALRPESTLAAFGSRALAMVVVHDANQAASLDPFALAAAFDLTPAESRVAARMADGRSPQEIAALHRVSLHTVQSQIRALFSKVGVERATELVAVLHSVPLAARATA